MNEAVMAVRGLRWRFCGFVLDEASLRLTRDGRRVALQRKPLEILMLLLRHAGEVVTREELVTQVWSRRVLAEEVLTKAIGKLRAALDDPAHRLIETAHGYGYRLAGRVELDLDPAPPLLALAAGQRPPQREHWQLERCLGRGGFGEVWLARHARTGEARVYKFATDAMGLSALRREITLHRVLHASLGARPDVVRLLDWNLSEPPCFAEFEYVEAEDLAAWVAAQAPSRAQRLEVIARAAEALAAAHAVGVLHKDLKPANVLVAASADGDLQVRLADFGSGRVVDEACLDRLGITRLGSTQVAADSALTPLYHAPELLAGQPSTVQADVYALGVLTYQSLIGDYARPLAPGWERDLDDDLLAADIAAAVDGKPERRLADAAELARRLRTLDARRARQRAEQQAAAQARQLSERLARMRQRRRWLLAVVGVLIAGLGSSLWFHQQARAQAAQAERLGRVAQTVAGFLRDDLLAAAHPETGGGPGLTVAELVEAAAAQVPMRFHGQPLYEGSIRATLGQVFHGLGDHARARAQLEAAIERLRLAPDASAERVAAQLALAETRLASGDFAGAQAEIAALLADPQAGREARLHAALLSVEADIVLDQGEAALVRLDALADALAALPSGAALQLRASALRARALLQAQRMEAALAAYRLSLAAHQQQLGTRHPTTLRRRIELGEVLLLNGLHPEARERLERAHAEALTVFGARHPLRLRAAYFLGRCYTELGEPALAEPLLTEALQRQLERYGEAQELSLWLHNDLANALGDLGRHDEALQHYARALPVTEALLGSRHSEVFVLRLNWGITLQLAGRWQESEALLASAVTDARAALSDHHRLTQGLQLAWAQSLRTLGETARARTVLAALVPSLRSGAQGGEDPRLARAEALLTELAMTSP